MVTFQRIIRHKGSTTGELIGNSRTVRNLAALVETAKRQKNVFVFIDADGNEGIVRSGRMMRRCDSVVRNTISHFVKN